MLFRSKSLWYALSRGTRHATHGPHRLTPGHNEHKIFVAVPVKTPPPLHVGFEEVRLACARVNIVQPIMATCSGTIAASFRSLSGLRVHAHARIPICLLARWLSHQPTPP